MMMCQGSPARSTPRAYPTPTDRRAPGSSHMPRRQDLQHDGSRGGHGQRVAKRVPPVATRSIARRPVPSTCVNVRDRLGHAVRPEGHVAGDRPPEVTTSGSSPTSRHSTRPDDLRVRLVEGEERPRPSSSGLKRLVKSGLGKDQTVIVRERRLGQDDRDIAILERPGKRVRVVERHEACAAGGLERQPAFLGNHRPVPAERINASSKCR